MDENKNLENLEEVVEEVAEEVVETAEDAVATAEEAIEEAIEEVAEVEEAVVEAAEETVSEAVEAVEEIIPAKKNKSGVVVAIVLALAIVAAACVWFFMPKNPYNKMGYVDISGKTVQDLADQMGVSLADFLAQYELPADMPADTTESAAYYNIPVKIMAQMFGMDFATMKETLHFPEEVTEDTTWGEAEGLVLLKDYVGEENLDAFKEQYGFGEEVTLETQWKDVRTTVDTAQKEARIEQEKAAAEAENLEATEEGEATEDAGIEVAPEAEVEGDITELDADEIPAE